MFLRLSWMFLSLLTLRAYGDWFVPGEFTPERTEIYYNAEYFSTSENYDVGGGSYDSLASGGSYKNLRNILGAGYDLSSETRLLGDVVIGWAQSDDGSFTRDNSEFTEIRSQALFEAYNDAVRLVPYGEFVYPFSRVSSGRDSVLTGEGAMVIGAGSWLLWPLGIGEFYGSLGVQYRDEGRATLMPWRAGAQFDFSLVKMFVELGGWQSIKDDDLTNRRSERLNVTNRTNGGSLRYYAVNPALLEARAWGELNVLEGWPLRLGLAQTLNGASTAHGLTVMAGLSWVLGAAESQSEPTAGPVREHHRVQERESPAESAQEPSQGEGLFERKYDRPHTVGGDGDTKAKRRRSQPEEEQFEAKQEKYDESLFKVDVTPKPKPKVRKSLKHSAEKPPKKSQVKPKKKAKPINVDKLLNETEKSLEN